MRPWSLPVLTLYEFGKREKGKDTEWEPGQEVDEEGKEIGKEVE